MTVIPEEDDNKHKTIRPGQSSSNQWTNSYYKRDVDESKGSRRINIGTSKALRQRQPNDEASDLKKGNQANESTTFE